MTARFFKQIFVSMSEQNDWLFRMIDDLVGEIRLVVENQRDIVLARNIFGSNDREFVPRNEVSTTCGSGWLIWPITSTGSSGRLIERNVLDASTSDRAAHRHAMQHAFEFYVVDIECLAGDFLPAFFAGDGFTDEGHRFRMRSSSLEGFGDAVSHVVVGTAT